ncbi:NACHT domain-containing protein [Leptolyngbya sp. AN02str]|uniref:NACHT domain-containing protein n=1 Tax=Leptolyngbya sp. AN02str TaxID=3423363 RepID=UPI003D31D803
MAEASPPTDDSPNIQQSVQGDRNQVIGQMLGGIVINQLTIHDRVPVVATPNSISIAPSLTQQEYRQRQVLLNKVKDYWVEGVLKTSLHTKAIIELGLHTRPDLVQRPFQNAAEFSDIAVQPLPDGTSATTTFEQMGQGRTLLILGKPGSGKTVTLLKLAEDLIARTEQDIRQPIPVVFNLSSWARKQQAIEKWLVQELSEKYQVSKTLGKAWVETEAIVVLLDGLDEVKAEHRNACVHALNQFIQTHGLTELTVCCRIQDYQALTERLKLRNAIYIQPLTLEQIQHYLDRVGPQLAGLKTMLQQDEKLRELATSPLIISVMSLAYQDCTLEEFYKTNIANELYHHLFDTYVERMFQRRGTLQRYTKEQAQYWLIWLAQQMSRTSQTVFLIERFQPDWLENQTEKIAYHFGLFIISGLMMAIMFGLFFGLSYSVIDGVTAGLVFGSIFGFVLGLYGDIIKPIETLKWSWKPAIKSLVVWLIVGLIAGFAGGLIYSFITQDWYLPWAILGLTDGFIGGVILGIGGGLNGLEIESKVLPNQGIRRSITNSIVFVLVGGCIGVFVGGLVRLFGQQSEVIHQLAVLHGLSNGVIVGFISGGGRACLQHLTLRLVFWYNKKIPWNYAQFLNYCTDRLFLQKVGGGYIFVHRMLLEHFAAMPLKQEKRLDA